MMNFVYRSLTHMSKIFSHPFETTCRELRRPTVLIVDSDVVAKIALKGI